ncbi:MAG TPA: ATP-binding cassette domain-containing protein, partial [Bauldia sp.]|nr:ATP-binding cassette domain-containing protein [Bauldia sp.]
MTDAAATPLAVEGISKSFPGVQALAGVSFDCRAGEVHALVGENGAGKSTLMRILAGVHQPDSGVIRVGGRPVTLAGPAEARRLGIAMVYQDTRLVPDLDVAQNIFLGREPGGVLVDAAAMRAESARLLARLGEAMDVRTPVRDLSIAERQLVEIARALTTEARVLILDEPTSALTPPDVERLFAILSDLRAAGTSIVFISHRLPEVFAIADRISVMKDGELVGSVATAATSPEAIVAMMVGRDLSVAFPPRNETPGPDILTAGRLAVDGRLEPATFAVRSGEILGLGGITGSGQEALVRALFGLEPASGTLTLDGKAIHIRSPAEAIAAGIVYLPADRRGEGMFLPHSVRENIALPHLADWARLGIVDGGREAAAVDGQIDALAIKTPSPEQPVGLLSGGNQQKVAFARWLLSSPRIFIFDEPTQGVDVGTKIEIYRIIRDIAARGIGVIVVSSDVIELIGLSDRILVVARGRIVDEVKGAEATEERIVGRAVGVGETPVAGVASPASAPPPKPAARRGAPGLLRRYGPALLLAVLVGIFMAYTASQSPYFLTTRNMANLAIQVAPLLIVALGQLAVVLLGGIDLSVGPTISLTTAIASFLLIPDPPFGYAAGIAVCLFAGVAIGLVNGGLVRFLRLPDLIATLATFSIVGGLALIVRPAPGGLLDSGFAGALVVRVWNVPVAFAVAVAAALLFELLLVRGRVGTRLYAVGSSEEAAYVAGIPVGRVRFAAYVLCGLLAAVAGLLVAARIGSGDPQAGTNFTLLSVTAVVLGGTSILGGRGTAIGVAVAAILIMLIQNAMNQLHVSAYWQYVLTGVLTLAAVAMYADRGGQLVRLLTRRRAPTG